MITEVALLTHSPPTGKAFASLKVLEIEWIPNSLPFPSLVLTLVKLANHKTIRSDPSQSLKDKPLGFVRIRSEASALPGPRLVLLSTPSWRPVLSCWDTSSGAVVSFFLPHHISSTLNLVLEFYPLVHLSQTSYFPWNHWIIFYHKLPYMKEYALNRRHYKIGVGGLPKHDDFYVLLLLRGTVSYMAIMWRELFLHTSWFPLSSDTKSAACCYKCFESTYVLVSWTP